MGRINTVYSNQIFIRVNAAYDVDVRENNLLEYGSSSTAIKYMKKDLQRALKNGELIDDKTIQEYSDTRATVYRLRDEVNSDGIDRDHMADFWMLSNTCSNSEVTLYGTNDQMVLITIDGDTSRAYDSIDDVSREYFSLDEVLDNGRFFGREMVYPFSGAYLLYTYGNLGILYFKKPDGDSMITPALFDGGIMLKGSPNASMKNPSKIKTKIYKMQKELRGQID